MFLLIVVLLLLAAMAGVLGAVLKATVVIVLAIVLAVVLLGVAGYSYVRYRFRRLGRDVQQYRDRYLGGSSTGGPVGDGGTPRGGAYPARGYRRRSGPGDTDPDRPRELPS